MSLYRIDKLFNFEKGTLQSSKCEPGSYTFITASAEWKTHNNFSYDCEAVVFAAAASGSLGRTHYVNGKFIASDLCFVLTPKDPAKLPIDLRFYHIIFNELRTDIVKNTKAGTSKEAISLGNFARYELPYFEIEKQIEIKKQFVHSEKIKETLTIEFTRQLDFVKQLRQSFLREAMQGKLVPQDPKDEPASELLQKIKAALRQAQDDKKGKKQKELPPVKENEIPFEVPENWVWCRLGEVSYSIVPNRDKPKSFSGNVKWITQTNFSEDSYKLNYNLFEQGLSETEIRENNCRVMPKGSVIMSCVGRFDLVALIEQDIVANQQLHCFVPLANVDPMYICYAIKVFSKLIEKDAINTTIKYINKTKCESILIPLPPLSEQHRIVAKLEQLMRFCDDLEQSIRQSKEQTNMLLQGALREALKGNEVEAPKG